MPQSLSNILVHLIFSTKHREPLLSKSIGAQTHAYMAAMIRDMGCECYRAGGVEDHVHFAIRLSRVLPISELLVKLKTGSSRWLKTQNGVVPDFAWQKGYGVFSAGYRDLDKMLLYIDGQEEHHRKTTFQDEYRALLIENGVEWDERYVWD